MLRVAFGWFQIFVGRRPSEPPQFAMVRRHVSASAMMV